MSRAGHLPSRRRALALLLAPALLTVLPPAQAAPASSSTTKPKPKPKPKPKANNSARKPAAQTSKRKAAAAEPLREPPNLAMLDERWITAGQPSVAWLGLLKQKGFDAVLYLAPFTVGDAVDEEPEIVRGQGLLFAHVPVDLARPTLDDYRAFEAQLHDWRAQNLKLLVHCQLNMRASTFSFLYQVRNEGADPEAAWAAVQKVWAPLGPWRGLVLQLLAENNIAFDPFT